MLAYNAATKAVELKVDRSYQPGEPVYAWCGPQPNSRLLINYGIVDESNPYDKLQVGSPRYCCQSLVLLIVVDIIVLLLCLSCAKCPTATTEVSCIPNAGLLSSIPV
jgi:hypothetical protein